MDLDNHAINWKGELLAVAETCARGRLVPPGDFVASLKVHALLPLDGVARRGAMQNVACMEPCGHLRQSEPGA